MAQQNPQRRQPPGTPSGGQFATANRPEIDHIDMRELSDSEHNARASLAFPPSPRNTEQILDFWLNVEIPDANLSALDNGRNQLIRNRRAAVYPWMWQKKNLDRRYYGISPRWRKLRKEQRLLRIKAENTLPFPRRELRFFFRMGGIYWDAAKLGGEEGQKLQHRSFTSDNGLTATPKQLVDEWELEWSRQFIYPY